MRRSSGLVVTGCPILGHSLFQSRTRKQGT